MNTFLSFFLATDNPVLPHQLLLPLILRGGWALVLGCGAGYLASPLARPYRLGIVALVMLWTLLPGSISPAFWLGLAFQAPSLMSVVICLLCLWSQAGRMPGWVVLMAGPSAQALTTGRASGVVLGWVLLIDTLALWPVSVYAWGFSAAAVALVALLATLFWGGYGASSAQQMVPDWRVSMLPCGVLILFVVSRWPTGNVWDALLDPWLWMFLQLGWCASVVRRWRAARSGSAAIPA